MLADLSRPSQTRNPAKYNKNAARNRLRAIEAERRKIHSNAVFMAQRLAAVHDPTGAMFNVKPVTILEDGRVVTLESIEKKKEREAQKQGEEQTGMGVSSSCSSSSCVNLSRLRSAPTNNFGDSVAFRFHLSQQSCRRASGSFRCWRTAIMCRHVRA